LEEQVTWMCKTPELRNRSRKESEDFEWSQISNNTRSRSQTFCPTLTSETQLDYFFTSHP